MSLAGDVRINQDSIVPTAFQFASGAGLGMVILDANGVPVFGFDPSRPQNAVETAVAFATGTVAVLPASTGARRGVILFNSTSKPVNISLSVSGATSGAFSFQLPSNGSWESELNGYQGGISAFWTSAPSAGPTLHVTEITS